MTDAIVLEDVIKRFGRQTVLDDLRLTVGRGSVFALLGPNGAGKTTIISILTTLLAPDHGTARVAGFDVRREPAEVRRRISLTGQSAAVDEILTGEENLRMMAALAGWRGRGAKNRTAELLDRFDLRDAARKRVSAYSGGMRRRLDLAVSLVGAPDIVFLDEPTTGLDTRSRQELWGVVRELAADGTTVFLTTQYLEEADRLADRIAVLDGGRIIAEDSPTALKARVGGEVLELVDVDGAILLSVPADGSAEGLRLALDELESVAAARGIALPGRSLTADADADADADASGATIALRTPSLDDVFLTLTSRKG